MRLLLPKYVYLHLLLPLRLTASQRGTVTGIPALKGPTSPDRRYMTPSLKLGTMETGRDSDRNSISDGSMSRLPGFDF